MESKVLAPPPSQEGLVSVSTDSRRFLVTAWAFSGSVLALLAADVWLSNGVRSLRFPDLVLWFSMLFVVGLLPIPVWKGLHLSVDTPVAIGVAILFPAGIAGLVAYLASTDPREFNGRTSLARAVCNRAQVGLSVFVASAVYHSLDVELLGGVAWCGAVLLAVAADYVVNIACTGLAASLAYQMSAPDIVRRLAIGGFLTFVASQFAFGSMAILMLLIHEKAAGWALPLFLIPMLFARQMYSREQNLLGVTRELRKRENLARSLAIRIARERQDERARVARELHDEVLQLTYRMELLVQTARREFARQSFDQLALDLEEIERNSRETQKGLRAVITDIQSSLLPGGGVSSALRRLCRELARESRIEISQRIEEISAPAETELMLYQIGREALTNVIRHSGASSCEVTLEICELASSAGEANVRLSVRDDGHGFGDPARQDEDLHLGLSLMLERAALIGGNLDIDSQTGRGTTINVVVPLLPAVSENSDPPVRAPSQGDREQGSERHSDLLHELHESDLLLKSSDEVH